MVMRSAALLLEVFERAGHAIEKIVQYLSRSPCVCVLIPHILNDYLILYFIKLSSAFPFRREVKNWRNMLFSGLRKQDLNSRMGTLILALWTGLSMQLFYIFFSGRVLLFMHVFDKAYLFEQGGVDPWTSSTMKSDYINHIPKSFSSSHYSASLDVQAKKQTEPIEQNVPQCLSKAKLARFARLLRKGMRIA
ncbi:hypothetical protein RHMOL_Rhmol06G0278800 [Rhododendron molle]|uniref:Uncharacterized protein n=1 Tax=Rhododendron molle TaxID=49168 RepID=A0ACC0NIH3_RHOML|nr:hypothetical protein RHMOL_Rhmol06G0278800 [Rhododendron molle]